MVKKYYLTSLGTRLSQDCVSMTSNLIIYILVAFINVFLHIFRSILVIKSSKFIASFFNCVCYTFSAVVIKFIAETELWIAITVQAVTNFVGCYVAMWFCEKVLDKKKLGA